MGWQPSRRDAPLAATPPFSVQVVIAPREALGAVEVHRLLENVRRGGGLIFDIDGGKEIADSLGVAAGGFDAWLFPVASDTSCEGGRSPLEMRTMLALPPSVSAVRWRRPPPGRVEQILVPGPRQTPLALGTVFSLGAGRVAVMGSSALFANSAIRTCEWRADVAAVRALDAVRPPGVPHPQLVFDEFHHGTGMHGGSMRAVSLYLAGTSSGHFLAQALVAALVLLLANAPRAIAPREPERIPRRSPLEHADALAHAYADVSATRTATSRLISGLRRRVGPTIAGRAGAEETAFLDTVVQRAPAAAASVALVRRALSETITPREFIGVGNAICDIEAALTSPRPSRS
jgi:hypothetical protein